MQSRALLLSRVAYIGISLVNTLKCCELGVPSEVVAAVHDWNWAPASYDIPSIGGEEICGGDFQDIQVSQKPPTFVVFNSLSSFCLVRRSVFVSQLPFLSVPVFPACAVRAENVSSERVGPVVIYVRIPYGLSD